MKIMLYSIFFGGLSFYFILIYSGFGVGVLNCFWGWGFLLMGFRAWGVARSGYYGFGLFT